MITSITDFAPDSVEAGTGLAIEYQEDYYVFFLAGTRHRCPPGEIFYAGIGGHREPGETWLFCAHREALEEIGVDVEILSAPATYYIPQCRQPEEVNLRDLPRPFALYEMIHPPDTPRAGQLYRIVVYKARLSGLPKTLPKEEIGGILALTKDQVKRGLERKPAIKDVLEEGALILAGEEGIDLESKIYPIGTAAALARIFNEVFKPS